ncbi:hypothetical protein NC651_001982 [Populus alba x Populus x berolinensis]|nr:hypothetical protein NC651_001982 [Populus alba x Populus x berolinensis]
MAYGYGVGYRETKSGLDPLGLYLLTGPVLNAGLTHTCQVFQHPLL